MTRSRLISLGEHRARLLGRARVEREQLLLDVTRIDASLSWIDVVSKGVHQARRHPLLVALGVAIVVALRPRNTVNLAITALSLWRLYHRARRVWTLASTLAASTQTHRP
ncbi:MAG TPA: YqjK family protein [Burkholderiales bacterium]|nr:YqjK family protein [Burkholderiales bacterium]